MDCAKVGALISALRKEKKMTQKEIAQMMNISDKTISKWERGIGCPDVSLLAELSNILGINIEKILLGDLDEKKADAGNMKKIKFYVCKNCSNIITATTSAEISCCGRKLEALIPKLSDAYHTMDITEIEDDYYLTMNHEMSKSHYISFIAFTDYDKIMIKKLYPQQDMEARIPRMAHGKFLVYCSEHGLFEYKKGK
jgi:DNA-binding XRE family transcriptional regulator/desulfoferrodoxin (superoxide reductase-like protein)